MKVINTYIVIFVVWPQVLYETENGKWFITTTISKINEISKAEAEKLLSDNQIKDTPKNKKPN